MTLSTKLSGAVLATTLLLSGCAYDGPQREETPNFGYQSAAPGPIYAEPAPYGEPYGYGAALDGAP